jgi:hypothetical protein
MEAQPAHLCAPAFLQHFASDFTTGFTTGTQAERQSLTAWKHSLRTSVLQHFDSILQVTLLLVLLLVLRRNGRV